MDGARRGVGPGRLARPTRRALLEAMPPLDLERVGRGRMDVRRGPGRLIRLRQRARGALVLLALCAIGALAAPSAMARPVLFVGTLNGATVRRSDAQRPH